MLSRSWRKWSGQGGISLYQIKIGTVRVRDERSWKGKTFWSMSRISAFKISETVYFRMISRTVAWPCVRGSSSRVKREEWELKMKENVRKTYRKDRLNGYLTYSG